MNSRVDATQLQRLIYCSKKKFKSLSCERYGCYLWILGCSVYVGIPLAPITSAGSFIQICVVVLIKSISHEDFYMSFIHEHRRSI